MNVIMGGERPEVSSQAQVDGHHCNPDAVRENCQEWFDGEADVYHTKYLERALPIEIGNAHAQDRLVGLLQVALPVEPGADEVPGLRLLVSWKEIARLIKMTVRPADQIVRYNSHSFLVVLPGLNVDVLHRIAAATQEYLREQFELLKVPTCTFCVGGVVVIPAGRKPAAFDTVANALSTSAKQAATSPDRISMLAVIGKKIQSFRAANQQAFHDESQAN